MPATVELQETVAVPDPVTVPGVSAPHVKPAGTVSVSVTTPAKPLTQETVIVEVALTPVLTAAGEVAVIVKSVTVKRTVVEWVKLPLLPVTITV